MSTQIDLWLPRTWRCSWIFVSQIQNKTMECPLEPGLLMWSLDRTGPGPIPNRLHFRDQAAGLYNDSASLICEALVSCWNCLFSSDVVLEAKPWTELLNPNQGLPKLSACHLKYNTFPITLIHLWLLYILKKWAATNLFPLNLELIWWCFMTQNVVPTPTLRTSALNNKSQKVYLLYCYLTPKNSWRFGFYFFTRILRIITSNAHCSKMIYSILK